MRSRWIMATIIEREGPMHSPAHPGEILVDLYMDEIGLSITKAADGLGVSRKHLSAIVNGRAPITLDMAVRLAAAFETAPDVWINLQAQYDIWQARQQTPPKVKNLAA